MRVGFTGTKERRGAKIQLTVAPAGTQLFGMPVTFREKVRFE
jgi:hypothetical protein